jgi:hypothetical protein
MDMKNISFSRENVLYLLPENTCRGLKGIVRLLEFGGVTIYIRSGIINWTTGKFLLNFNDKVSREEDKTTIYSDLRISGVALSNQSDYRVFQSLESQFKYRPNPRR